MTLERGAILHKRYRISDILGEGGMGAVYRAVDENLGIEVAVKENFFTSEEYARQFKREANILASMRHPNLPRVTDHFVIRGQGQYLVLDYIEGEDLRTRIDRLGTLPEEDVLVLGIALCDALTYLHERTPTILHRDIKPGNVKITPSGEVFLVDFGLAKIVEGSRETTPGARAMTPGYSPPEQYGTARTDPRSDVYSLGATLYEALTSTIPEDGLGRLMAQTQLVSIRRRNPDVTRKVAAAIEKAMAVQPEDRFQSTEEFRQALVNASRGSTRRRLREGVLNVSPPPDVDPDVLVVPEHPQDPAPAPELGIEAPFPVSAQIASDGPYAEPVALPPPKKRRTRWGRLLLSMILGGVLGILLGAFLFLPELSSQALAMIAPVSPLPPGTVVPEPSATGEVAALERPVTPTPSPSATALPASPTAQPTPVPTETAAPVILPDPTDTPLPSPTPMGGGAGQIAFASNRSGVSQIWLINADGSGLKQVTDMPEGACQPAWAPDGTRFVFISPCRAEQEIYPNSSLFVINADGSELAPLPTILGGDYDPDWSPDGSRIVFTSLRNGNRPQLFVLHLEDMTVDALSEEFVQDFQPVWSPDGSIVAFVSNRKGPNQLWTMDPTGLSQDPFSRSGSAKNSFPEWSPDGNVLIYTQSAAQGGVPTLYAARFEEKGLNEFRIHQRHVPSRAAKISPDGFWLAYEGWPEGQNHDIFVMTVNGVDRRRLTAQSGLDFDPAWRPPVDSP